MIWETGFKYLDLPEIGKPRGGGDGGGIVVPPEDNRMVDEVGDFLVTDTGDFLIWA